MKTDMYTIELRGVEFVNKGAELMLHAVKEQVALFDRPVRLVMETSPRATKKQIRAAGLFPKSGFGLFGDVKESEVDMVLDASGYAYGDPWGAKKAKRRISSHIRRWKQDGKVVILLPQAFGPFRVPELRIEMKTVFSQADRVFVRDSVSMAHVSGIHTAETIIRKPDFTNLVKPLVPKDAAWYAERVAIIPNIKMIVATDGGEKAYLDTMRALIDAIRANGREAFILLHEADQDVKVAALINSSLSEPLRVVKESHPLMIKGIIGASYAVATSRFHGLVSALSQGVPCIATSWSHKYEELLTEYEYLQGLTRSDSDTLSRVNEMLSDSTQKVERAHLTEKAAQFKLDSTDLWKQVRNLVTAHRVSSQ
jgi:colanic acid/amylovoran biosynthesis protein